MRIKGTTLPFAIGAPATNSMLLGDSDWVSKAVSDTTSQTQTFYSCVTCGVAALVCVLRGTRIATLSVSAGGDLPLVSARRTDLAPVQDGLNAFPIIITLVNVDPLLSNELPLQCSWHRAHQLHLYPPHPTTHYTLFVHEYYSCVTCSAVWLTVIVTPWLCKFTCLDFTVSGVKEVLTKHITIS